MADTVDQKPDKTPPKGDLAIKDTDPKGASLFGFNPWGIHTKDVMDLVHHVGSLRDALFPAQAPDPSLQHLFSADWAKAHPDQAGVKLADRDALEHSAGIILGMVGGEGGLKGDLGDLWHGAAEEWQAEPGHPMGRFRSDKILSGEGAHAQAHGAYMAEARSTGDWYRNAYGRWSSKVADQARSFLAKKGHMFEDDDDPLRDPAASHDPVVDAMEKGFVPKGKPGALYKLRARGIDKADIMDWDKPLKEQSNKVKQILIDKFGFPKDFNQPYTNDPNIGWHAAGPVKDLTGEEIHNLIAELHGPPEPDWRGVPPGRYVRMKMKFDNVTRKRAAAQLLNQAGIRGVRYPADNEFTRFSHNYVIFDPDVLQVVAKYGIAGLLGSATVPYLFDEGDQTQAAPQG
jgi:hypothetical protein